MPPLWFWGRRRHCVDADRKLKPAPHPSPSSSVPQNSPERDFLQYRQHGDAQALGRVFDAVAPELLLIAMHLGAEDQAEDLVQVTFLQAIEHQGRWDARRRLVPWLVGILGNLVRDARRQRGEQELPRDLLEAGTEDPPRLEGEEFVAAVRAAVGGMAEEYRQVLNLRLLHGLELRQIALALGLPLGTVKTRLRRGLERLRRRLPAGLAGGMGIGATVGDGLAAVRAAVLSHATPAVSSSVAGTLIGVLLMHKSVLLSLSATLLLLALWQLDAWSGASPGPDQGAAHPVTSLHAAGEGEEARAAKGVAGDRGTTRASWGEDHRPAELRVLACWEGSEDGVPGQRVELALASTPPQALPLMVSDSDVQGSCRFADLNPGDYRIRLGRIYEPVSLAPGERRVLRLEIPASQLDVQVVDPDGVPVAGAAVHASGERLDRYRTFSELLVGHTDRSGRLRRRVLMPLQVWARKDGWQPSMSSNFAPEAEGAAPMVLRLGAPAHAVTGQVVDPAGLPIGGARVLLVLDKRKHWDAATPARRAVSLQSDARGWFHSRELPAGSFTAFAYAPGYAYAEQDFEVRAAAPTRLELRLRSGARVEGLVRDEAGRPLPGIQVMAHTMCWTVGFQEHRDAMMERRTVTAADGSYLLSAVAPGAVSLAAWGLTAERSRRASLVDGEAFRWDVNLARDLRIHGEVRDHLGRARAGIQVRAEGETDTEEYQVRETRTDPQGRFVIAGLQEGRYRVSAHLETEGRIAQRTPQVHRILRPSTEPCVLQLPDPTHLGWIAFRVRWPARSGVQRLVCSLDPGQQEPLPIRPATQSLQVGRESFRIGPVPAGRYVCHVRNKAGGDFIFSPVRVLPGAVVDLGELRLDLQRPLVLDLRLPDGRPAAGLRVRVSGQGLHLPERAEGGRYTFTRLSPGPLRLLAAGPGIAPVRRDFEFRAESGVVQRFGLDAAPTVELCFSREGRSGRWVGLIALRIKDGGGGSLPLASHVRVDCSGEFVMPIGLRPGSYVVEAREPRAKDWVRRPLRVEPGARGIGLRIELPQ